MSHRAEKKWNLQGRCEQLEPRTMLAGHGFAEGFFASAAHFNHQTASAVASAQNFVASHISASNESASTSLTASLTDTNGNTATVTYQTGKLLGVAESVIKITGDTAAALTSVAVTINGQPLGSVALDSTGAGSLIVPTSTLTGTVAATSTVAVGGLTGTFAASTTTTDDDDSDEGSHDDSNTSLTGALTDTNGNTATVTYQTGKLLGVAESVIKITGDTAAALTSVAVTINGQSIGPVTLDSTGAATLIVPTSTLTSTVAATSTVAVGGLTGTFAASTTTTDDDTGEDSHKGNTSLTGALTDINGNTATVTYQTGKLLGVAESVIKITGDTAAALTSVVVTINGQSLGPVTLDSTGAGTLMVPTSTLTSTVAATSTVAVGGLTGTLVAASSGSSDSDSGSDCGHDHHGNPSLTAPLTDPTGGAGTATVTYQTGKLLGVLQSVIKVSGDTTAANTTVPVTINGQVVGSVTLDSTGLGTLTVPTSSLTSTVGATSTVAVGSLTGTFTAALSTTTSWSAHASFFSHFGRHRGG